MCGRFCLSGETWVLIQRGYASHHEAQPLARFERDGNRKAGGFPHIRRQGRVTFIPRSIPVSCFLRYRPIACSRSLIGRSRRALRIRTVRVPRHASHESWPLEALLDVVSEFLWRRLDSAFDLQLDASLWPRTYGSPRSHTAHSSRSQPPIIFRHVCRFDGTL